MQLFLKLNESESGSEWTVVELQGELETKSEAASLDNKFIGDLHFTSKGIPILIIGHHILYGKVTLLEKPFLILTKSRDLNLSSASDSENSKDSPKYQVKAIVKRKLLFKTRPKPIITNVPKKL